MHNQLCLLEAHHCTWCLHHSLLLYCTSWCSHATCVFFIQAYALEHVQLGDESAARAALLQKASVAHALAEATRRAEANSALARWVHISVPSDPCLIEHSFHIWRPCGGLAAHRASTNTTMHSWLCHTKGVVCIMLDTWLEPHMC